MRVLLILETCPVSTTSYPPTDCTAVLSAMAGLTAEFGMGSGDPCLHGRAHGTCSLIARRRLTGRAPWRLHGALNVPTTAPAEPSAGQVRRSEELGLLVPLA